MSDVYSAVFSPYQQSTLGVSSNGKWVIYPPPAKEPSFYLGCRPFDLDPPAKDSGYGTSPYSKASPALHQMCLSVGTGGRWCLMHQIPRKHDLQLHILSLPVELRLEIFSYLLVTGSTYWGPGYMEDIHTAAQVTVDASGQLRLSSLREQWPEVFKVCCVMETKAFRYVVAEIFWGMNEVVLDVLSVGNNR